MKLPTESDLTNWWASLEIILDESRPGYPAVRERLASVFEAARVGIGAVSLAAKLVTALRPFALIACEASGHPFPTKCRQGHGRPCDACRARELLAKIDAEVD